MKWPFVRRSKYENMFNTLNKIKDEHAQLNHDMWSEINRLNQELANENNSHRETKINFTKLVKEIKSCLDNIEKGI